VNKNDLIAEVADDTGLSKSDAARAVDAVFDAITKALKKNNEVRLVGFGTFSVAKRAKSKGRNPRTGEEIQIPASKLPKFKAGKGLKATGRHKRPVSFWAISSVGRALPLHGRCRRFESVIAHQPSLLV
jgi:DNA-binding protein HU-beta